MARWMRFEAEGRARFGRVEGERVVEHEGDLFAAPRPTGREFARAGLRVLTPTAPSQMVALWNNYRALAAKLGQAIPPEPLWFLKSPSSFLAHGEAIRKPAAYEGKVVYEAELGIVIGRRCRALSEDQAAAAIFGYTCVNDVTAIEIIARDASFAQWSRAKSFDTFGVFGPVVATGLDPAALTVKLTLDGQQRQDYPASDMIFPPAKLVSLISRELTLQPGDVICCGTSVGVGSMKPGSEVAVTIDGIGTLSNRYE